MSLKRPANDHNNDPKQDLMINNIQLFFYFLFFYKLAVLPSMHCLIVQTLLRSFFFIVLRKHI